MTFLFYIFAAIAVIGGIGVVVYKNPVSSAFAMILSFLGLAAIFIQLDAYLVGILQILVYAGAIMVLFLFIIMLMDVKEEEGKTFKFGAIVGAVLVVGGFTGALVKVLMESKIGNETIPALAEGGKSDVHEIGELLFSTYWFPIQIIGVLLLVATVGVILLSRKELK
ncbi:NADH-quinone oxidoreductase subunit J [Verrucomicrobiales bacterium]|jgi:NADH-quinone oxidoreductase subunit J|nr:NADH-quinone oxidoreductase subunit J [Verrucomicrobiales bacterium]MDC0276390.1 NADH-quinone oxidoreductase subunit J [Verrucomicrobiales bacterium]MDC0314647.1 NADH-quinone oxidoreductase subunit J [bacterium]MDC0321907.1 NADH-quinone oxidoreductase subunit J [Verrucomicrobiales bacterium]